MTSPSSSSSSASSSSSSSNAPSRRRADRRFTWRGRVAARAFYFASSLDDFAGRAIRWWQPGARLFSLDGGVLLVLARAVFVDARTADGLVFVDVDGVLASYPMSADDRARFTRGALVVARGGVAQSRPLSSLATLDASFLVDTSALDVVDAAPLAPPAPPAPPPEPERVDARATLLGDTEPNPARDAAARALRSGALGPQPPDGAAGDATDAGAAKVDALVDVDGNPLPDTALRRAQARAAQGVPAAGAGESLLRVVVRALEATGLMDRVRRMHREYVEDTLERLKRGELDDALKRAIPLGRPGEFAPRPPAMTMPTPRASLHVSGVRTAGPSTSIDLGDDLFTRLRNSYRDAAKKLERQRRFREAAFVYIELLGEIHEAIALLERASSSPTLSDIEQRELLRLAAQLAESWDLPSAVVVRHWILAGDTARATDFARRRRAFADAIALLERTSRIDDARALRVAWATHLADAGAFASAIDAMTPLTSTNVPASLRATASERIEALLERGIAAGGVDVPRLVARRLLADAARTSTEKPRDLERAQAIVDDDGPDAPARRVQLAYALGAPPPSLRAAGSAILRALYADVALGVASPNLRTLAERLADPALRADLPSSPPATPLLRHPAQVLVVDGAPGHSIARAVAPLPEGRVLAGLGEAGALVATRIGGAAWRTSEPCDEIVLGDSSSRALLVARRGTFLRIAKVDTAAGGARAFVDVRADHVASSTDGDLLFLARDRDLLGLDLLAADGDTRVLWQTRLRGPVFALARDEQTLTALHDDPDGLRLATFDARTLFHRETRAIADGVEVLPLLAASAAGEIVGAAPAGPVVVVPAEAFGLVPPHGAVVAGPLAIARNIAALGYAHVVDDRYGVVVRARSHTRLVIELRDARPTALFVRDTTLVVADDHGRVFVVDAANGEIQQRIALP
jgi:hypothetical protein